MQRRTCDHREASDNVERTGRLGNLSFPHINMIASQRDALAAGFRYQPSRDGYRAVDGERWQVRWYSLEVR